MTQERNILAVINSRYAALLYLVAQVELYRGEPRLSYEELRRFFTQSLPISIPQIGCLPPVPFGIIRKGAFGKDTSRKEVPAKTTDIRDMYKAMIWRTIDDVFGDYEQLHGRGLVYVRNTRDEDLKTISPTYKTLELMPLEYVLRTDFTGKEYEDVLKSLKDRSLVKD
jgi:hypothetical protein